MAKYVIEIPSGIKWIQFYEQNKGGVHGKELKNIGDLTPYTEPDRKAIEDEVWEFASMLMNMHPDVAEDIYWSMNGGKGIGVATEMTYQQAKAKYEEWRKKKDEIHVGDEVEAKPGNKACVLYENPDGTQVFVFKADGTAAWWSKCTVHKTGKNHPEFVELLKKMKGE